MDVLDMLELQPAAHESIPGSRSPTTRACTEESSTALVHVMFFEFMEVKNLLRGKRLVVVRCAALELAPERLEMVFDEFAVDPVSIPYHKRLEGIWTNS